MDCVVSFSLAALKCFARDRWIGLIPQVRNDRLCLIASNSRFPTLPCHHCPNPGSRILSGCRRPGNRQHLSCRCPTTVQCRDSIRPCPFSMVRCWRPDVSQSIAIRSFSMVTWFSLRRSSRRPPADGLAVQGYRDLLCPAPGKSPRWSPGAASWRRDGRPPKTGSRPRTSRLAAPGSRAGSACPAVAAAG